MANSFSPDNLASLQRAHEDAWWLVVTSGYIVSRDALAVIIMALAADEAADLDDTYNLAWEAFTKATSGQRTRAA